MAFLTSIEGKQRIVLDGRPFDAYGPEWTVFWPLAMSDDASTVACKLTNPVTGKSCVGINGRRGEEFDEVGAPVLSGDGTTVAYRAQSGGAAFVVVGKRKGPAYDFATDPALDRSGNTAAYGASRGGRWFLVRGGREEPLSERPSTVFISPDGRTAGYCRLEGAAAARIVVEGRAEEEFDLVGRPAFSPDGMRMAYAAETRGMRCIVIDGRKTETPDRVTDPVFSPDGREIAYGARKNREIWWKILRR